MIHKVVAECWLGKCPEAMEVDHIDRNPHNNDYRNLRYVTKNQQMKNRDHTNIAKHGSINLEIARQQRAKPVRLYNNNEEYIFNSFADGARFLAERYNIKFDSARDRFKKHRKHIYDFDIEYLNAETRHAHSTE
jgi:hypothetical protein